MTTPSALGERAATPSPVPPSASHQSPVVESVLQASRLRLQWRGALRGAAGAMAGVSLAVLLHAALVRAPETAWTLGPVLFIVLASALAGGAVGALRARVSTAAAARVLEPLVPTSRNLLVTAEELLDSSAANASSHLRVDAPIAGLVLHRAEALARTVSVPTLLPLKRRAYELAGSAVVLTTLLLVMHRVVPAVATGVDTLRSALGAAPGVSRIIVRVEPPAYSHAEATTDTDPVRISALAGSRILLSVDAAADSLVVTTRDTTRTVGRSVRGTFDVAFAATADGFVAFTPRAADGRTGTRRLVGITVRTDAAPRVRIVEPARDLIVPDANRTLAIGVEADDDLALGTLRLRYTKVSGSGERFTFSEGEVPLAIARSKPESWTARASLALEPLLTEPGDLVVYRAVATDTRPGSPPIESDAFIAELAAPGGVAALGFSLDPDEDRYALSQQMVILKTERLIAQRTSLGADTVAERAAQLAMEQRRVRAEFVFMMGGEFAQEVTGEDGNTGDLDETAEAESESDLAAGRMVNRGRTALLAAVRAMSRAGVALTTSDLTRALAQEKMALTQLQEAFARNRFLMRALSQREQLDLTRRLTGRLDSIARGRARVPSAQSDMHVRDRRALLAELTAAASRRRATRGDEAPEYVGLAERLLQTDPSSPAIQQIARQLSGIDSASPRTASVLLDSAVTGLTSVLEGALRPAAASTTPSDARRLRARLEESLARSGARRPGGTP